MVSACMLAQCIVSLRACVRAKHYVGCVCARARVRVRMRARVYLFNRHAVGPVVFILRSAGLDGRGKRGKKRKEKVVER